MRYLDELPQIQRRVVLAAREAAASRDLVPWLVGGPVRDLELGRPVIDLDLALETGVETFARELARMLGGTVRAFPQFLTFKIVGDELPEVDVATTRSETYARPGALPEILPAGLREDLSRRDFTINAMAVDAVGGSLVDPFRGMADLRARLIRVLHPGSFRDDPTRIYRGLRLASRLEFEIEPRTDRLISEALAHGALGTVSRERLWREVFLAIDEPGAGRALLRLANRGALETFASIAAADVNRGPLPALDELTADAPMIDRHVVYLGTLLRSCPDPATAMEGASLSRRRKTHVLEIVERLPGFIHEVGSAESDPARLALFRESSAELILAAAANSGEVRGLRKRFEPIAALDIGVRGSDLGVPPGPHIAVALERTREALFFGEIAQEDAAAFARSVALQYLRSDENQHRSDETT